MRYTLGNYLRDANIFEFPDWFYGVEMKRFDEELGQLVDMKPWKHQIVDLNFLACNERAGLYNDAGVGKTIPMQAFSIYMAALGNKVVIGMPPKLIGQFTESLVTTYQGVTDHLAVYVLDEKQAEAEQIVNGWVADKRTAPDIVLMSYEMFAFLQPLKPVKAKEIKNSKTGNTRIKPAIKAKKNHPLRDAGFNVMVFDEAHKLKNPESAAHKRVWRWVRATEGLYQLVLATGTPIYNQLSDAYGLIRLITPGVYNSMRHFESVHAVVDNSGDYKLIVGWKNEDVLHENLYKHARRVTNEEVNDLPPMIPYSHLVKLYPEHKALYKELMTTRVLELEDEFIDASHQSKLRQTALQLISDPNRFSDTPIRNAMDDWLDGLFEDIGVYQNKIVVLAYYKNTIERLSKKYAHLNPAVINGSGGNSDANRIKFLRDPTCRVLFLNWRSGGAGLNLQVSCYEIFYEVPTVPGDIEQTIARIRRGGQKHAQHIHIPRIMSTLANKSFNQLLSKQGIKDSVVRDKHDLLYELLGR